MLTAERARELLNYDPETGLFAWKVTRRHAPVKAGDLAGVVRRDGYYQIQIDCRRYLSHRLAWFITYGVWPPNLTDHINGIRNDNRISNLRLATNTQNAANVRRPRNKSGYRGVTFRPESQKWSASIGDKSREYLGTFTCPKAAHEAYVAAARAKYGEFARAE